MPVVQAPCQPRISLLPPLPHQASRRVRELRPPDQCTLGCLPLLRQTVAASLIVSPERHPMTSISDLRSRFPVALPAGPRFSGFSS